MRLRLRHARAPDGGDAGLRDDAPAFLAAVRVLWPVPVVSLDACWLPLSDDALAALSVWALARCGAAGRRTQLTLHADAVGPRTLAHLRCFAGAPGARLVLHPGRCPLPEVEALRAETQA